MIFNITNINELTLPMHGQLLQVEKYKTMMKETREDLSKEKQTMLNLYEKFTGALSIITKHENNTNDF